MNDENPLRMLRALKLREMDKMLSFNSFSPALLEELSDYEVDSASSGFVFSTCPDDLEYCQYALTLTPALMYAFLTSDF